MDYLKNTRIHQKCLGISYKDVLENCNTFSCNHGLVIMRKYLVGGMSIVLFIVIKLAVIWMKFPTLVKDFCLNSRWLYTDLLSFYSLFISLLCVVFSVFFAQCSYFRINDVIFYIDVCSVVEGSMRDNFEEN